MVHRIKSVIDSIILNDNDNEKLFLNEKWKCVCNNNLLRSVGEYSDNIRDDVDLCDNKDNNDEDEVVL